MKLEGARILLTGATGGIGSSLAEKLQENGCEVLHHGYSSKKIDSGAFVRGDLSKRVDLSSVVRAAELFNIDILINNCGVNCFSRFEDSDIETIVSTNVIGPMRLTQSLLPHLRSRPEAAIVNIGSAFGQIGYPGYVAYCASKHAIKGFSESLGRELADTSVRVQYFSPRATRTDMNSHVVNDLNASLGVGCDEPDEVADQIVQMLLSGSKRYQMGGPEKAQVKINSLFPGMVDSALSKQLPEIRKHYLQTEQVN